MKTIRVGSRDSALAVRQAELIMTAIRLHCPDAQTELVAMKTSGDRILDRPLESIGGKGLFIKELDDALLADKVDICVHSYKDLPVPDNPALPVIAASVRETPEDVLILPPGQPEIDPAKPVGTSSLRRQRQMGRLYPGVRCASVRGNVQTRLRKLDAGEYSGLVLAAAGVKRIGLWERVNRVFTPEEMLPAAGQGILAVQARAGGEYAWIAKIHCRDAGDAAAAERAFVEGLGADCASPVAAHATVDGETLRLRAWYVDEQGTDRSGSSGGKRADAREIGLALAAAMKQEGGPCRKGL